MEESRTKNSIKNVKTGAMVQIINKVMAFVVRTVFIRTLNTNYLGVNGLFTNVLAILSFAELGIGTAIIFNMYKPVAENNQEKIKSLMNLYKKAYNIIAAVIFILGICVIPFLKFIVKDVPDVKESVSLIYFLFLTNTTISYLFTYKKSIISAHQKQSVINNVDSIFYFFKSILEIIFLLVTQNYIVYLIVEIISTLSENCILSYIANRMYPYLKEKNIIRLSDTERKGIFGNVKALVVYKFGGVIMNGIDNILISSMISVEMVGYCSNYIMIINSVKNIILSALNGITASVGNLNAVGNTERKESVFYQITFVNFFVYTVCAIIFVAVFDTFISIWIGEKYVLGIWVSIALALSFWIEGLRNPCYTYRVTLGLFERGKITPYIGAIANIFFSIILCKVCGVVGIILATSVAQLVSYCWIDPVLIHKYEFKKSSKHYFFVFIKYILVFILETIITLMVINNIKGIGILDLIIKLAIATIIPIVINIIIFHKTTEYKELEKKFLIPIINKVMQKKGV